MRNIRMLALGATMLVLLGACSSGGGSKPTIRVASQGFAESKVMAELYAQALEANGYTVDRKFGLGARKVTMPAIEGGQIDLLPEYIGSALGYYDKTKTTPDAASNAKELQAAVKAKGLSVLDYTPGQDTNAFVVRTDTATSLKLTKMSDLAAVQDQLTWGLPPECESNALCAGALKDTYGITFPPAKLKSLPACGAEIAQALQNKGVDIGELCSTQAAIGQFGFVVLDDDRKTQPAENIAPLVRDDYLSKVDAAAFRKILNDVSAKVTTDQLRTFAVEIEVKQRDVADVAKEWLRANGFVK